MLIPQAEALSVHDLISPTAHGIATQVGEMPEGDDLQRLLDASAGLTRQEAEKLAAADKAPPPSIPGAVPGH